MKSAFSRHPFTVALFLLLLLSPLPVSVVCAAAKAPQPVRARKGMVASAERLATQVGVDILKSGGNAVDASVAVAFALAVTFPEAGNLGGGGFMMIRRKEGTTTAIDYRETAPARATRAVYLGPDGKRLPGEGGPVRGYRAVGVPGTVAGMALAHRKYGSGKRTWAQLIEPARRLAAQGFVVRHSLARSLGAGRQRMENYADSRRIFLNSGRGYAEGQVFKQPDLAATLARLQKVGPRDFYEGETARRIAADMAVHNGLITADDLRRYAPRERMPVRGTYRGYTILSMPPPSSGGFALMEMLNILEGYDLRALGPFSSERHHLVVEAMRRVFADRSEYGGDTDFVRVPVAGLLQKSYANERRASIDTERASQSETIKAGAPAGAGAAAESPQTTHFTVVDAQGGAVSNTYTLNSGYGSGVTARGTGVLLNNEMDDFMTEPGAPNQFGLIQGEKNAVGPGKRPLSSMSPTFVLRKDGTLYFAVGSPGGPTIINTVLQIILNVVDHDMNLRQAIDAPRLHHQWLPDEIAAEPAGLSGDTERALTGRGHKIAARRRFLGDAQGVMIEAGTGVRLGWSDARGDGLAAGH